MAVNRLRRLSQSIRRSKSQSIRRSKSQPFLRREHHHHHQHEHELEHELEHEHEHEHEHYSTSVKSRAAHSPAGYGAPPTRTRGGGGGGASGMTTAADGAPHQPKPQQQQQQQQQQQPAAVPSVVHSSWSRRYVHVSVADFVTSPACRRSTPRQAVGPVDVAVRPPCYEFNAFDHGHGHGHGHGQLPPSSPVDPGASSTMIADQHLSLDIGTRVMESYPPNHHFEPSHLVQHQYHQHQHQHQQQQQQHQSNQNHVHRSQSRYQHQPTSHAIASHRRAASAVPVFLVNDREYFERLAHIVKARPSEHELSDRSASTIASCYSCHHPNTSSPHHSTNHDDAICAKPLLHSLTPTKISPPPTAGGPPSTSCRFPKYRVATDDASQLVATEMHLYSSPCISSIADSSANSTFISTLSINTNSSSTFSSSQCASDLTVGATRDASSANNSSILSQSQSQPQSQSQSYFASPPSRHITATPDYSDAQPIDIGSDIQSALQSRNVSEQVLDTLLDDADRQSSESSEPHRVIHRSDTYLLLPEPYSSSSSTPSNHSILRSVHSVNSIADLTRVPSPPPFDVSRLRKSLPSFWQQKIQSPVKYTFRPLHKVASHSTNKSRDDRTSSPLEAPVIQRAIGRRPVPVPTVPSPPSSDSNPSSVGSPAASITPPRSKLRLPRFEKNFASKRSPNPAISAPIAVNAIVDSVDPRAMLEAVNIPAMSLSPARLFRKSRAKRTSNESSTTTSTEYYEDDYTKFIEKNSTSPLRLLPHPSFARLIGADGRALRTSRCDEQTNSSLSLSTSDEEYRPFCSKLEDCSK